MFGLKNLEKAKKDKKYENCLLSSGARTSSLPSHVDQSLVCLGTALGPLSWLT